MYKPHKKDYLLEIYRLNTCTMIFLLAGVCEPIDTPMCQEKNKLFGQELNCEQKKNCAALNEQGRGELLSWRVIYNSLIWLLIYSCQIDIPFVSILLIVMSHRILFIINVLSDRLIKIHSEAMCCEQEMSLSLTRFLSYSPQSKILVRTKSRELCHKTSPVDAPTGTWLCFRPMDTLLFTKALVP